MELCPCGSGDSYEKCCSPYHSGAASAPTAEALMRSRYCAYVKGEIEYLIQTVQPDQRHDLDRKSVREWSEGAEWLGLEILNSNGGEADNKGQVEFIARFRQAGAEYAHHEISRFRKRDGCWFYVDGKIIPTPPPGGTFSRNAPCPCGSGKKYKRCCAPPAAA